MRDGSGFTLERRDPNTREWRVIGKYSSELAAATALDEAVGQARARSRTIASPRRQRVTPCCADAPPASTDHVRRARGVRLGLTAVGLVLATAGCTGQTATVSRLTIVNGTRYNVDVAATNAARREFLPLATVSHNSQTTVRDVLDQGYIWVFRFEVYARPMGEIQLTRRALESAGWRVAVPAGVQQRAQAAGIPPPPP